MHVLVVGAGLGGLCLAQGLRRSGLAVTVYERDSGVTARFQGYRIGLAEHGIEALRASLPERWYRLFEASVGDLAGERPILDAQLEQVGAMSALQGIAIDRHVLRHLLLTGLDVHFGKELVYHQVLPDQQVEAVFRDGTTQRADVLVGAEGINSRCGPPSPPRPR